MASRRNVVAASTMLWLAGAWTASFSCFTSPDPNDASDSAGDSAPDASCIAPFGCGDSAIVDPFGDASLAVRVRALFDQTCSGGPERGCHSELAGATTLTLDLDSSYGIIDVPSSEVPDVLRVAPYQPESSYLYWKVSGDPRIADGSGIMPLVVATDPTSGSVDPRIVGLIGPWIEAGAP